MPKKESNNLQDYPNAGLLHPSKYVSASDLRGREVVVTIKKIEPRHKIEVDGGKKEAKVLVLFAETDKGWLLNITCSKVIQGIYGRDPREWIGKLITIFPTTCEAFGETVECIRVKAGIPAPKQSSKKQEPPPEPTRMKEDGDQFGEPRPEDDDGAFSDDAMGFGD